MFVDQYHDTAYATLRKTMEAMPELHSFVKSASIEVEDLEKLSATSFAWPEERLYPIHTPEHAALSYAYCKTASLAVPDDVEGRINKALDVFNVPRNIFDTVKVASDDSEDLYAFPEQRRWRIKTATELKKAEHTLETMSKFMPLDVKTTAAAQMVKRAHDLGIEPNAYTIKTAGLTKSNRDNMREWIEARAMATKDATDQKAYRSLSEKLAAAPKIIDDRDGLIKIAKLLSDIDKASGVDKFYGKSLPDPVHTVFNGEKLSASSVDLGGVQVPIEKLMALPPSFWTDLAGEDIAAEIGDGGMVDPEKLAVIVETLPLDLKTVIRTQLGL